MSAIPTVGDVVHVKPIATPSMSASFTVATVDELSHGRLHLTGTMRDGSPVRGVIAARHNVTIVS